MSNILEIIGETFIDSIKAELKSFGLEKSNIYNNISYTIQGNTIIQNLPQYQKYIENGRRPYSKFPPALDIIAQMKRKGIARGNENKVVFLIQRKIARDGIDPRPFLSNAVDDLQKQAADYLAIDFSELIDEEIKKYL